MGQGIYALPNDTMERDASLATLMTLVPGLRVGGKTALAWRGIRHNLAFKETLALWGSKPAKLPAWFTTQFPAHYQATQLFDETTPSALGIAPLPSGRPDVPVSTPERAVLELLSDVGKRQKLEETRHLLESAGALRQPVLDELLSHLTRIKVARLAYDLANELELPWKAVAHKHSQRLGGGARWVAVGKMGERLDLKRTP
ncbi:type IV toxin-antitoxin system AbiEi family antitoxin domain-containing protein [soil metagenome]